VVSVASQNTAITLNVDKADMAVEDNSDGEGLPMVYLLVCLKV
jgi:hypothetical protein